MSRAVDDRLADARGQECGAGEGLAALCRRGAREAEDPSVRAWFRRLLEGERAEGTAAAGERAGKV
jgi:hypothetical protein